MKAVPVATGRVDRVLAAAGLDADALLPDGDFELVDIEGV